MNTTPHTIPKFRVGQDVAIQPTPESQPIFITIEHVWFVESFGEYAYMSMGGNTAWEREIRLVGSPNVITLTPGQPVTAKFTGPHAAEIIRLFNTDTIPTPFDSREMREDVLRAVAGLNPDALVRWA